MKLSLSISQQTWTRGDFPSSACPLFSVILSSMLSSVPSTLSIIIRVISPLVFIPDESSVELENWWLVLGEIGILHNTVLSWTASWWKLASWSVCKLAGPRGRVWIVIVNLFFGIFFGIVRQPPRKFWILIFGSLRLRSLLESLQNLSAAPRSPPGNLLHFFGHLGKLPIIFYDNWAIVGHFRHLGSILEDIFSSCFCSPHPHPLCDWPRHRHQSMPSEYLISFATSCYFSRSTA